MQDTAQPEALDLRRQGDLLWVRLNDPERANALSPRMLEELTAVYRRPLLQEGVRALLLTAAGRNFSGGADLEHLRSLADAGPKQIAATLSASGTSSSRCCGRRP